MNCDKKDLLLYAVTDRAWLNGETLCSQVEKAIKGGATFIQLREKNLDQKHFLEEALEIQKLCKKYNVPFVINDNVEIAKEINADGAPETSWYFIFDEKWELFKGKLAERQGRKARRG